MSWWVGWLIGWIDEGCGIIKVLVRYLVFISV